MEKKSVFLSFVHSPFAIRLHLQLFFFIIKIFMKYIIFFFFNFIFCSFIHSSSIQPPPTHSHHTHAPSLDYGCNQPIQKMHPERKKTCTIFFLIFSCIFFSFFVILLLFLQLVLFFGWKTTKKMGKPYREENGEEDFVAPLHFPCKI